MRKLKTLIKDLFVVKNWKRWTRNKGIAMTSNEKTLSKKEMEIVKRLNENWSITVVMVLHELNQAVKYSDYLLVVKDKGIYTAGAPDKVMNETFLKEVFGVRAEVFSNERGEQILTPVEVLR